MPSSAERYGALVASPYDFAASAEEAEWAGRVVDFTLERATVRAIGPTEAGEALQAVVDVEAGPVVAPVVESRRTPRVEVRVGDGDGTVQAEPCGGLEFPSEIGVDDRISAGIFCLPEIVEPSWTIRCS